MLLSGKLELEQCKWCEVAAAIADPESRLPGYVWKRQEKKKVWRWQQQQRKEDEDEVSNDQYLSSTYR